jgi:hypothetical protein
MMLSRSSFPALQLLNMFQKACIVKEGFKKLFCLHVQANIVGACDRGHTSLPPLYTTFPTMLPRSSFPSLEHLNMMYKACIVKERYEKSMFDVGVRASKVGAGVPGYTRPPSLYTRPCMILPGMSFPALKILNML